MTKFFVGGSGNYLGGFDGAEPPQGAVEVPTPPADARQTWSNGAWGAIPARPPEPPTAHEWLERLPSASQLAIIQAGRANDQIQLWLMKAAGARSIDVTNAETIAGVNALVAAGVITTDDQATLLAP